MSEKNKGRFIVFEGIDGSGKSTQIKKISKRLAGFGYNVYSTFEPTDGPIGSLIRQMLSGKLATDQRTIASLFAADRTDHLVNQENGIGLKVHQGEIVLCDRYYFSSYAYHAQHIDMKWVIHANSLNADILRPDVTIFIDVDPDLCFERIKSSRNNFDMYEKIDVMKKVRANYFQAFDTLKDLEKIIIIDGNTTMERVEDRIFNEVKKIIKGDSKI
ncbi:MAG: dTMP kinase [Deltaproteobacteria bacterium]|uniref:dTMP kinase n=1 Tax=Desulfobacula sp. TaxID=2593537 RepID=UPI00198A7584|nr:dTMP kinase [Candidatus Desulfobacula maris]MBL6993652.1 dTMP kinase [Desulfobacula sp.]